VKHFVLDADQRIVEVDLHTWGGWMGAIGNHEIARTGVGHLLVLTSFAGIDISFGDGPPAFFEAHVLDGCDELECLDPSSWEEALGRHQALTERSSGWADVA
jgi:hypothetical protein